MILESFPWIHEERVVASVPGVSRPGLKFVAPALPGGGTKRGEGHRRGRFSVPVVSLESCGAG